MAGDRNYSDYSTVRLNRTRYSIEVESPDITVTFHPNDYDRTYNSITSKCSELYPGYQFTEIELRDIEVQLTEIYRDYAEDRNKRKIGDGEHLLYLARSQIKQQFRDQTGAIYAVIERDGHDELLKMNSDEFDRYLGKLFFDAENKVITKNIINNSKRILESFTTETQTLYHRIAKLDDTIYYDLNNEQWQCVKITKDGWEIVKSPMIFYRSDITKRQVQPRLPIEETIASPDRDKRWIQELIDKFYFKDDYQKKIAEVYIITLFIPDFSHPINLVTGPRASGKTLLLKSIRQVVDPRDPPEALVERLPRDEKDRRVKFNG